MTSIKALKVFSEGKERSRVTISVEKGIIKSIKENTFSDYSHNAQCLAPAFFDTHINGGEKHYFTQDISKEAVFDIVNSSKKYGTDYTLPCLITSSLENILAGIKVIKSCTPSIVPGMHLEGPFLNLKKRGAHLAKYVRNPTDKEINTILKAGAEVIKIWTIAPENFSWKQIAMIQEAGVTLSAGHSNATYFEAKKAFGYGIDLVTHLYNAMSPFHHRDPGLIGAALDDEQVWAPIIPDGKHCDWGAARIAFKAKPEKLFLISDALFLSRKKETFQWEEFDAKLTNNSYYNSEGNLAGAAISLDEGVRNAIDNIGIPVATALSMASDRPAKATGLDDKIGKIEVGYPASFISFDENKLDFKLFGLN